MVRFKQKKINPSAGYLPTGKQYRLKVKDLQDKILIDRDITVGTGSSDLTNAENAIKALKLDKRGNYRFALIGRGKFYVGRYSLGRIQIF